MGAPAVIASAATSARISTKHLRRDGLEPGVRIGGLAGADLAGGAQGADAPRAFHIHQNASCWVVDVRHRDPVGGGDDGIACVQELGAGGRLAPQQQRHGAGADLGLGIGGEGGFGHGAGDGGIADHMHAGAQLRREGHGIDGAPAALVGHARRHRDATGLLGRDDIGHISLVPVEFGHNHHVLHGDFRGLAAGAQRHPFKDARIKLLPGHLKQLLLGESVLGVEHDELRLRLMGLEIMGDQAGALIGAGRAAIGIGGNGHDDHAPIPHGLKLAAQQ